MPWSGRDLPEEHRGASVASNGEPYGLLRDARLWMTAGLVAVFALAWQLGFVVFGHPVSVETANFLPLGIFLVPVLYAAITFGLRGGMLVAAVSVVATVPWIAQSLEQQDPIGAWFDFVQVVVLVVVAYFVGRGVRDERLARLAAERSRRDHLLAEIRYRDLFETNSQPILLCDPAGSVVEANVAALDAFDDGGAPLLERNVTDIIGRECWEAVRLGTPWNGTIEVPVGNRSHVITLRPEARQVAVEGEAMVQIVFQDVTVEARRRLEVQAYAADVVKGQEDERRRIAQELHDGPLQTLVHVCRLVDRVAGNEGDQGSATSLRASTVAQLRAAAESAMAEVRQISRGLRPSLLDDLGLVAALERLCDEVESRAGVAAVLRTELDGTAFELTPATELTVYRVAQEALSNVDRHAAASTVEMYLTISGASLELRIVDDGTGFDSTVGDGAQGGWRLGLRGMAERAALSGGRLTVRSVPGRGTSVMLTVPLGTGPSAPPPMLEGGAKVHGGAVESERSALCRPPVPPHCDRGDNDQDAGRPAQGLPYVRH
ncbi:MAG: sensor histidine kinase [Actinomycetota bacterium]|jgi:signal transduction histidine kinase|nr:sensor histidine kinase [Actinomycetota bacterium]